MIDYYELVDRLEWKAKDGCWIVTSHKKPNNRDYPVITINRKVYTIHRAMCIAVHGDMGSNMVARHTCDNPMCINPDHILPGTKQQNTQDMFDRDRQAKWEGGYSVVKGDRKRKLTQEQITKIKESPLSSYQLAEIYPVSSTHIRRIRSGSRCSDIQS